MGGGVARQTEVVMEMKIFFFWFYFCFF
jgi:hypothetical protein